MLLWMTEPAIQVCKLQSDVCGFCLTDHNKVANYCIRHSVFLHSFFSSEIFLIENLM